MSAALIAVVAALVIAHASPALAASIRRHGWFGHWLDWLHGRLPGSALWHGAGVLAASLLPPMLLLALLRTALDDPLFGLPGLLLDILVLIHAWGPRDLGADVEAVADARDSASRREAARRLWPDGRTPSLDGGALVGAVFDGALRRWFGPLLWFLLLGPAGALGYRLLALLVDGRAATRVAPEARRAAARLLAMLDWPVAQLMTLALALVGDFDAVLGAWRTAGGASLRPSPAFLGAVARASVRSELAGEAADDAWDAAHGSALPPPVTRPVPDLPELRDAMSQVWRCLLLWLAVLALFVIGGWVR